MKDTGHVETAPWEVLVWHHRNAQALLDEAIRRDRDPAEIHELHKRERRYRSERVRRAVARRP